MQECFPKLHAEHTWGPSPSGALLELPTEACCRTGTMTVGGGFFYVGTFNQTQVSAFPDASTLQGVMDSRDNFLPATLRRPTARWWCFPVPYDEHREWWIMLPCGPFLPTCIRTSSKQLYHHPTGVVKRKAAANSQVFPQHVPGQQQFGLQFVKPFVHEDTVLLPLTFLVN